MFISISNRVVDAHAQTILDVARACGMEGLTRDDLAPTPVVRKNYSLVHSHDLQSIEIAIDDAVLIKLLSTYSKMSVLIAPIISLVQTASRVFARDMAEVQKLLEE